MIARLVSDWFNRLPPSLKATLSVGSIFIGGGAYGAMLIWLPPAYALALSIVIFVAWIWFPLYWLYGGERFKKRKQ